jgi:hypothetical protein
MKDFRQRQPSGHPFVLVLAWAAVGVPLAWGIVQTVIKAMALFL